MKKLLAFLANGTEEIEALTVVDYCRRAEIEVDLVSINDGKKAIGAHKIFMGADKILDEIEEGHYDAFYIPGGMPGAANIRANKKAIEILKIANKNNKLIAALCASPLVLEEAKLLDGKNYTCYPGIEKSIKGGNYIDENIVVDGNLITGKGPALAAEMAFNIIERLQGEEVAQKIRRDTLYNLI